MKLLILLYCLVLSFSAYAENISLKMYSSKTKKYEEVKIFTQDGLKISSNCIKKGKPDCEALRVGLGSAKEKPQGPVLGNPAARYCAAFNAGNRILKDEKNNEYDYCVFSDGSMIDSWSLYYRHHK
ncbi:MAG: hypothetical protein OM95_08645 [Bdellovibrio sp. ArHS]|uniref:DUF333 domain-containing protein n=1 Tax=Bdellovibrio sp. ArHS TaxID=1569284 RepID=UPI000583D08A|nr:DUF333 domain-containing protein [Bdellovibrio sp. ArHS]KHD88562.1 MAG: hypothetical protein OM95_08645 [Bdellovibrio sp. ArHS]